MKKKSLNLKETHLNGSVYCVDVEYCENLFLLLVRHV